MPCVTWPAALAGPPGAPRPRRKAAGTRVNATRRAPPAGPARRPAPNGAAPRPAPGWAPADAT